MLHCACQHGCAWSCIGPAAYCREQCCTRTAATLGMQSVLLQLSMHLTLSICCALQQQQPRYRCNCDSEAPFLCVCSCYAAVP